jgi:hypothetical protein
MTDLNVRREILFCGKIDEWVIMEEWYLAKAKHCGFNELLPM